MRDKPVAKRAAKKTASAGQPLAQQIAVAARPAASPEAREKMRAWLAGIRSTAVGKALDQLAKTPVVATLLARVAEGSPHLWHLASAEPARLLAVLESDPDRRFADLLGEGARAVAATSDEADAMRLLRRLKAEASLLVALADIGGVWPVMRATRALTELADAAVSAALRHLLNAAVATGKLRPPDPAEPE